MKCIRHFISITSLLFGTVSPLPGWSETLNCTPISSLPYTITTQGIYCFTENLATSITIGNAIEIQTNNVTVDLNGHKLGGLAAGDGTQAVGIFAYQRKNITVKNGIIRGFMNGIRLFGPGSGGHVVKGLLVDQNTYAGIEVEGLGNTVSGNTVVDTGGSTVAGGAIGVIAAGSGAKIVDNEISATVAASTVAAPASGVYVANADYSLIQNNTVTGTSANMDASYAIYIINSAGVFLRNNNVANADYGLVFSASSGKYFNNLTFDVATPFVGGTAIGSANN